MIQWLLNIFGIQTILDGYEKRIIRLEKDNRKLRETNEVFRTHLTHLMARNNRPLAQEKRLPVTLKDKLISFFDRRPQWNLKTSTNRRNLIQFINEHKEVTKNTLYGYLISWKDGETTVGYVGQSSAKTRSTDRPRIILGSCRSIDNHNAAGESILLNDISIHSQGTIKEIVYFVACNTGPYINNAANKTLEKNLYSTLGGQDGKRTMPSGQIVSVEQWIMWLNRQAWVPQEIGTRYASKKGGRERSIHEHKDLWVKYAEGTGFFV